MINATKGVTKGVTKGAFVWALQKLVESPIACRFVRLGFQNFWRLSKALRALPRRDSEETRKFPRFQTRHRISITFCGAVRFFNISVSDSYMQ